MDQTYEELMSQSSTDTLPEEQQPPISTGDNSYESLMAQQPTPTAPAEVKEPDTYEALMSSAKTVGETALDAGKWWLNTQKTALKKAGTGLEWLIDNTLGRSGYAMNYLRKTQVEDVFGPLSKHPWDGSAIPSLIHGVINAATKAAGGVPVEDQLAVANAVKSGDAGAIADAVGKAIPALGAAKEFITKANKFKGEDLLPDDFRQNNPITSLVVGGIVDVGGDPLTGGGGIRPPIRGLMAGNYALSAKGEKLAIKTAEELRAAYGATPDMAQETAYKLVSRLIEGGEHGLHWVPPPSIGKIPVLSKTMEFMKNNPYINRMTSYASKHMEGLTNAVKKMLWNDEEGKAIKESWTEWQDYAQGIHAENDRIFKDALTAKVNQKAIEKTMYEIDGQLKGAMEAAQEGGIIEPNVTEGAQTAFGKLSTTSKTMPENATLWDDVQPELPGIGTEGTTPIAAEQPFTNLAPGGQMAAPEQVQLFKTPRPWTAEDITDPEGLGKNLNDIIHSTIEANGLSKDERLIASKMSNMMLKSLQAEKAALGHNFSLETYYTNAFKRAPIWQRYGVNKIKPAPGGKYTVVDPFGKKLFFNSIDEALSAGYKPESTLYPFLVNRITNSQMRADKANLIKDLTEQMGKNGKIPERLTKMFTEIGAIKAPPGKMGVLSNLGAAYMKVANSWIKPGMTRLQFKFPFLQVGGNSMQMMLEMGMKSTKFVNPYNWGIVGMAQAKKAGQNIENIGGMLGKLGFHKWDDLKQIVSQDPWGRVDTLDDVISNFNKYDVFRDVDIVGQRGIRSLQRRIQIEQGINKVFPQQAEKMKFLMDVNNFPAYASHIENFFRGNIALMARQMGHDWKTAAKIADETFFPYSRQFKNIADKTADKVFLFYKYPRFASELIGRVALSAPGRIVNLERLNNDFWSLTGKLREGSPLTERDKTLIPGWRLSNPGALIERMTGGRLKYQNQIGLDPMSMFNSIQVDDNGDIDVGNSLMRNGVAMMGPYMTMPIEAFSGQLLYNGQPIKTMGSQGDVTPEKWVSDYAQALGMRYAGLAGTLLGRSLRGANMSEKMTDGLKGMLQWEDHYDEDGTHRVYISPWWVWAQHTLMADVNQYIKMENPDLTPTDKFMDTFFKTSTAVIDPKKVKKYKLKELEAKKESELGKLYKKLVAAKSGQKSDEDEIKIQNDIDSLKEYFLNQKEAIQDIE